MKWTEEMTETFIRDLTSGWDWEWPGWKWLAKKMTRTFGEGFTAESCRKKAERYYAAEKKRARKGAV